MSSIDELTRENTSANVPTRTIHTNTTIAVKAADSLKVKDLVFSYYYLLGMNSLELIISAIHWNVNVIFGKNSVKEI